MLRIYACLIVSVVAVISGVAGAAEPLGLVLTWQQDPLTTMTIDWHTPPDEHEPALQYRVAGSEEEWQKAQGATHDFPYSDRKIHRIELTGLTPDSTYAFQLKGFDRVYQFETMPENIVEPLHIAAGGDLRHDRAMMTKTNIAAMERRPDFILWGGDLAYANADPRNAHIWYEFFDVMMETLIDANGRVVPIVTIIGNHEVFWTGRHEDELDLVEEWGYKDHDSVFFYDLFAHPKKDPGYGVLDFGNYLSLILLNSDQGEDIHGEQAEWLEDRLAERADFLNVIPVYHVAAYPSVRDFDGWACPDIREHWVPKFEEHDVKIVFEHHDHAYKRTHPIKNNAVHEGGIVFLGDGAWGVGAREVHSIKDTWYLAKAEARNHFYLLTLQGQHQHVLAIDADGQVFDEYPAVPVRR